MRRRRQHALEVRSVPDGAWTKGEASGVIDVIDPAPEEPIGQVAEATRADAGVTYLVANLPPANAVDAAERALDACADALLGIAS